MNAVVSVDFDRLLAHIDPQSHRKRLAAIGKEDAKLRQRCMDDAVRWMRVYMFPGENWKNRAACKGKGKKTFFCETNSPSCRLKARKICVDCPVRKECLFYAATVAGRFGIWAGLTPDDLAKITVAYDRILARMRYRLASTTGMFGLLPDSAGVGRLTYKRKKDEDR